MDIHTPRTKYYTIYFARISGRRIYLTPWRQKIRWMPRRAIYMEMKQKPKFERKSGSSCRDERTTGRLKHSPSGCVSTGRTPTLFCRPKRAETTLCEQQARRADNIIPTSDTIRGNKNHHGCRCERDGREVLPTLSEEKNETRWKLQVSTKMDTL